MILQSLRATFGRLEEKTLELSPGLNIISGDNETGKSTWAAFLTAMLYGVDTKSRIKGGKLPVRLRYAPWSGKPMAGTAELIWQGQRLRLERTSETGPMAELTVTDADTGCRVESLCTPDCGRQLLGAEAEVYERSGMIRQQGPAVSADPNLERRLNGLVTAVSEDYAYADIDAGLKRLQNAVCYNRTGILPRLEAELAQKKEAAEGTDALLQRQAALSAELRSVRAEQLRLVEISEGLELLEQQGLREELDQTRTSVETAEEDLRQWQQVCGVLPPEPVLDGFREQLDALRTQTQTLAMEERLDPIELPEAPTDPRFQGRSAEEAAAQAERDAQTVREGLEAGPPRIGKFLLWLLPGIGLLAGGYLIRRLSDGGAWNTVGRCLYWAGIPAAVLALGWFAFSLIRYGRRRARAVALLEDYVADSAGQIQRRAAGYIKDLEKYQQALAAAQEKQAERDAQTERLEEEREALLDRLRALEPACTDLSRAELWLSEAARSKAALDLADRTAKRARTELDQLAKRVAALPVPPADLERFRQYDPAQIKAGLNRCAEQALALRSELDRVSGALEHRSDPLALAADMNTLEERIAALKRKNRALELARATLEQADADVRARFAPLLCARTGALFSRLTEGRYDRVSLDRSMRVTVHPRDSATDRPLSVLSGGTVDQLYLALRLAICELLLPEAPIVLDDALVYFDDNRARIALQVLKELAKDRQILLFTCQGREKRLLRELAEAELSKTE